MVRRSLLSVFPIVALALSASAEARRPGTLTLRDTTRNHVVSTTSEDNGNEKEVEVGDVDNDGDLDVVVANGRGAFERRTNKLYLNDGAVFTEVSGAPIIPGFEDEDLSRNAFLRDFDGDGWLDLVIVNDAIVGGDGGRTKYYANRHPGGVFSHFEDDTSVLPEGAGGFACGAASDDLDGDGRPDLYVGNYPFEAQDTLYLNGDAGDWSDVTDGYVPLDVAYTVDVTTGDMNGDGRRDVLVSNHFGPNVLYFNDRRGEGDGPGDLDYEDSVQLLPEADEESAMEVADLNGDGRLDIYFSNHDGIADAVLVNAGRTETGVLFETVELDLFPSTVLSRKATIADFNRDGRPDVWVMAPGARPTLLRNTSVGGALSFVDWTPAPAVPEGNDLRGWHAAAIDADGDGRRDLFVGGDDGDHLLRNVAVPVVAAEDLGGRIAALHELDPVAIFGSAAGGATATFSLGDVPAGARLAAVLTGCSDLALEIVDAGGSPLALSERGGFGIEEALQLDAPGGELTVRVTVVRPCGDADEDGDVDRDDGQAFLGCLDDLRPECQRFDFDGDGTIARPDAQGLRDVRTQAGGTASGSWTLELLSRP